MEAAGVLSCTFGLGYILQSSQTALGLVTSDTVKELLVQRRRLVLLSFLVGIAFSAAFQFAAFLLLTPTPCKVTVIFSVIFDEAARTAAVGLGIWSSWRTPIPRIGERTMWAFVLVRIAIGITVVVYTNTSFMPVCFPISNAMSSKHTGIGHSPGLTAAAFDGIVFLLGLMRAWTVWQSMGERVGSERRQQGMGQVLILVGFFGWTMATIPFRVDAGRSIFVRLFPIIVALALLLAFIRLFPDAVFTVTQNMADDPSSTDSSTRGLQRLDSNAGTAPGSRGIVYSGDVEATKPATAYNVYAVAEPERTRTNSAVYRNIIGAPIMHPGTMVNWSPETGLQSATPRVHARGLSAGSVTLASDAQRANSFVETTYPPHAGGNHNISGPILRHGGFNGPSADSENNESERSRTRQSMMGSEQTTPRTIASFAAVGGMTPAMTSRSTSTARRKPAFGPPRVSAVNNRRGLGIENAQQNVESPYIPPTPSIVNPTVNVTGEDFRFSQNTISTDDDDTRYTNRYSNNNGFQLGAPPRLPMGARRDRQDISGDQRVLLVNDIVYDNPALVQSLVSQKPKDSAHTTARYTRSTSGVLRRSPSAIAAAAKGRPRLSPAKEADESPVIPLTTPVPTTTPLPESAPIPSTPVMNRKRSLQERSSTRALFPRELRSETEFQRHARQNSIPEYPQFASPPPPPREPLPAPPVPKVECPQKEEEVEEHAIELIPIPATASGEGGAPMEFFFISKDSPEIDSNTGRASPSPRTLAPPIPDRSNRSSSVFSPGGTAPVTPSEAEDAYETAKAWIASVSTVQRSVAAPVLVDINRRDSVTGHARHDSNPLNIVRNQRDSTNTKSIFVENTMMRRESSFVPYSAASVRPSSNYAESVAMRKSVLSFLASPVIEEEESEGSVIDDDEFVEDGHEIRTYLDQQSPPEEMPGSMDDDSYSGGDEMSDDTLSAPSDLDDAVVISDIEDAMVFDRIALTERKLDAKIRELSDASAVHSELLFSQRHFKLGDQVPTFYASRFERYGNKRRPPPPPLGLRQRPSRQSRRLPQVEEVQQGIQRRLTMLTKNDRKEAIEDLIERLPAPTNRRSIRPTSVFSDGRSSLLAKLESEVGQQESQWQGMSRIINRDSIASSITSTDASLESAAETTQRRLSQRRSSLARLSVGVERRLSIAQTTASSATLTTATTTVSAGGWQRQMAEAQEAYLKQAPELMQKFRGYPLDPEPAVELLKGESMVQFSPQMEYIEEVEEYTLPSPVMQIPEPSRHELWCPPAKAQEQPTGISLWDGNSPVIVDFSPAAIGVRPRKTIHAAPLRIESTRLWNKPRALPPRQAPILWRNPKDFRPKSIIQWGAKRNPSKRVTFVEEVVTVEPTGIFGRLKKLWGKPETTKVKRKVEVPTEPLSAALDISASSAPVATTLAGITKEYENKALPPLPISTQETSFLFLDTDVPTLWAHPSQKKIHPHDTSLWPTGPALSVSTVEPGSRQHLRSRSLEATLPVISSTELWKPVPDPGTSSGLWRPRNYQYSSGLWSSGMMMKTQAGIKDLWNSCEKRPKPRTNLTLNLATVPDRRWPKRTLEEVKTPVSGWLWSNRASNEPHIDIDPGTASSSTFSECETAVIESATTVLLWRQTSKVVRAVASTDRGSGSRAEAESGSCMRYAQAITSRNVTDPNIEAVAAFSTSSPGLTHPDKCEPWRRAATSLRPVPALLPRSSPPVSQALLWTHTPILMAAAKNPEGPRLLWADIDRPGSISAATKQRESLSPPSTMPRLARSVSTATTPVPTMTGALWQRASMAPVQPKPQLWRKRPLTKGLWTSERDGAPTTPSLKELVNPVPGREPRSLLLWNSNPKAVSTLFDHLPVETLRSKRKVTATTLPVVSEELWKKTVALPSLPAAENNGLWRTASLPSQQKPPNMWSKDNKCAPLLFAHLPTDTLRSKKDDSTITLPVFSEDLWKKQTPLPRRPQLWRATVKATGLWDAQGRTQTLMIINTERRHQKHLWNQKTASRTTTALPERTRTAFRPSTELVQAASGSLWKKPSPEHRRGLWKRTIKTVSSTSIPPSVPLWASHTASRTTTQKPLRSDIVPKKSYTNTNPAKASGSLWRPQSSRQKAGLWKRPLKTVATHDISFTKTPLWNKHLASRRTTALPVRTTAPKVVREETLPVVSGSLWTNPANVVSPKALWTPAPTKAPAQPVTAPLWHQSLASRTTSALPERGAPAPRKPSSSVLLPAQGELWARPQLSVDERSLPDIDTTVPALWQTRAYASSYTSSKYSSGASSPALSATSTLSDVSEVRSPPPPSDSFNIDIAVRVHRSQSSASSIGSMLWQAQQPLPPPVEKTPSFPSADSTSAINKLKLWSADSTTDPREPTIAAPASPRLRITIPPKSTALPVFDRTEHKLWATAEKEEATAADKRPVPSPSVFVGQFRRDNYLPNGTRGVAELEENSPFKELLRVKSLRKNLRPVSTSGAPDVPGL